jgi:hypothetical protein
VEGPRWHVWVDDGDAGHSSHASLEDAERQARKVVRDGKKVEITDDDHNTIALVAVDALDRVWTDVRAPGLL